MTGTRVEVRDASKSIDGAVLLHPTSFAVRPGTCVVLRGPNGAGKTTALRLAAGLTSPSTGTVTLDGEPADERRPATREAVAALLGTPAGWRDLTLVDHLTLVDASWGRDPSTCHERVLAALDEVGIAHLPDRFPHELSSGQTQLFHLALTLFRPARLLVLDEPEQRLDTDRRMLLAGLLAARRDRGTTILLACHDPAVTEAVADGVVDIDPGHR
ncbi:ABC transporter ATP-binding protein [Arthrobacter sp. NEB 688]|uniref:ABC transporter ATP-binding protein n=1 Tax=Arthrobacter sp. NEB 688 TaxID=904039 RepID=UPI001565305C|nr:ABC transporter ATP-binding protein [Arthrobacter sp. NEB 688]QKE83562.1 ABC transporter ATP-binding protein [Arthrobacter sp. NEB 688]